MSYFFIVYSRAGRCMYKALTIDQNTSHKSGHESAFNLNILIFKKEKHVYIKIKSFANEIQKITN